MTDIKEATISANPTSIADAYSGMETVTGSPIIDTDVKTDEPPVPTDLSKAYNSMTAAPDTEYLDFTPERSDTGDIVNIDKSEYSPYITNVMDTPSLDYQRAINQSTGEQIGRKVANLIPNIATGILENIGYTGALFSEFGDQRDYTNALTELAQKAHNPFGEAYRKDPSKVFDLGDPAWWINHGGDLLESVGEFYVTGMGVSKVAGSIGSAVGKSIANAPKMAKYANAIMKGSQAAAQVATSFDLAYLEGAMSGAQVYKEAIANGSTPEQASEAAARTVHWNTAIVGLLNMGSVAPLFQKHQSLDYARKIGLDKLSKKGLTVSQLENFVPALGRKSALRVLGTEALQEGVEEDVNIVAEYLGKRKAGLEADDKDEITGAIDKVFSEEGALNFILGAAGGVGQTAAMHHTPINKRFDESGRQIGRESSAERDARLEEEQANKYINDLKEDLKTLTDYQDQLKQATVKRHLQTDENEIKQADAEIDELKSKMFTLSAYRSILNGTGDYLTGTFNKINSVDNTKLLTDDIDEQIRIIQEQQPETEEETAEQQEKIKSLQEERREVTGKTAAIVAGLTDHIENEDDLADPTYYKNVAQRRIADLQKLTDDYKQIYSQYSFDTDEELAGVPDYIFQRHAFNYMNERNISDYRDQVSRLESQMQQAQTKAGVSATATQIKTLENEVAGQRKALKNIKRKQKAQLKKMTTQKGRNAVRKEIGFTGKRFTKKALDRYYDAIYNDAEANLATNMEQLIDIRKGFKGTDEEFAQQVVTNELQDQEIQAHHARIHELESKLKEDNLNLEKLKTASSRKDLVNEWKETRKNLKNAFKQERLDALDARIKEGGNEAEIREEFGDLSSEIVDEALTKANLIAKQEATRQENNHAQQSPVTEEGADVSAPVEPEPKEAEPKQPTPKKPKVEPKKKTLKDDIADTEREIFDLEEQRNTVQTALDELNATEVQGQPIGVVFDRSQGMVEDFAKQFAASEGIDPESTNPKDQEVLEIGRQQGAKRLRDQFNSVVDKYVDRREDAEEEIESLTEKIKLLKARLEGLKNLLPKAEQNQPKEGDSTKHEEPKQSSSVEPTVRKEIEVVEGMTYIYMPEMVEFNADTSANEFVPSEEESNILSTLQGTHIGAPVKIEFASEEEDVNKRDIAISIGDTRIGFLQMRNQTHGGIPLDLLHEMFVGFESTHAQDAPVAHGIRYSEEPENYWTTKLSDKVEILSQKHEGHTLFSALQSFMTEPMLPTDPRFRLLKSALSEFYNVDRSKDDLITDDLAVEYAIRHMGNVIMFDEKFSEAEYDADTIKRNLAQWSNKIFVDHVGAMNIQKRLVAQDGPIETTVGAMSPGAVFHTNVDSNVAEMLGTKPSEVKLIKTDVNGINEFTFRNVETGEVVKGIGENRKTGYRKQLYTVVTGLNGQRIPVPLNTGTIGQATGVAEHLAAQTKVALLEAANNMASDVSHAEAAAVLERHTLIKASQNFSITPEGKDITFDARIGKEMVSVKLFANHVDNLAIQIGEKGKTISQKKNPKAFEAAIEQAVNGMKRNIPINRENGTFEDIELTDHTGKVLNASQYKEYLIRTNALTTTMGRVKLGKGKYTNIIPNTNQAVDKQAPFTLHLNNPTEKVITTKPKAQTLEDKQQAAFDDFLNKMSKNPLIKPLYDKAVGMGVQIGYDSQALLDSQGRGVERQGVAGTGETTGNIVFGAKFHEQSFGENAGVLAHELIHSVITKKGRDTEDYVKLLNLLEKFGKESFTDEFIETLSEPEQVVFNRLKEIAADDAEEIITYALTNPMVMAVLARTESNRITKKSYWDMLKQYVNAILKQLGVYVDNNKLQEVSDMLDAFMKGDFSQFDETAAEKVEEAEAEEDPLLAELAAFGDDNIDTHVKLAVALDEGVLANVELPDISTGETKPYHMSIFNNMAEELHGYNVIRNVLTTEMDAIKDAKLSDAILDPTKQVKNIVITAMRRNATNLYKSKAISADNVKFTIKMLEDLSKADSVLWNRVKAYMFQVDGIRITEAQEKLEGKELTEEELTQVAGHWESTDQFKISVKDTVSNKIKNLFNTTLKINPNTAAFKQNEEVDLDAYIQANVERATPSGFAEAITWSEYSNYMINIMSGSVDAQDMMDRLYTVAAYNPTLLPLFYRVNSNNELRKEWFRHFKNQSPVSNMGLFKKQGLDNYSANITTANRESFIEYTIADDYQSNIIAKIEEGSYNFNKDFVARKLAIDKISEVTPENLSEVAKQTAVIFNELGLDVKPVAIEYELKQYPVDQWNKRFRSVFSKSLTGLVNSINQHIEARKQDANVLIEFKNLGDTLRLAKTMRLFRIDVGDASYINHNGDLVYTHQKTSFFTDWFDKLHSPKKAEELLRSYASVPKNQHSNWLWNTSDDKNNPNGFVDFTYDEAGNKVFESVNTKFTENSRHGLHAGHKNTSLNRAGEYKDLTPNDWAMQEMVYYLNSPDTRGLKNKVEWTNKSVADAGHTVTYTGIKIPLTPADMDAIGTSEFKNSEMFKALYNVFLQEYVETKMAVAHTSQGGLELFQLDENLNVMTDEQGSPIPNPNIDFNKLQLNKDYINSYKNVDGKRKEGKFLVYPADAKQAGQTTGNVFKFLNMECMIDGQQTYLHEYVDGLVINGVVAKSITPQMQSQIEDFINRFAEDYMNTEFERFAGLEQMFDHITDNKNQKLTKGYGTVDNSPFKHAVTEYALNSFIKNVEEGEFWGGDTREYKGALDANKRYGQTIKNGHVSAADGTFTSITIADRFLESPVLDQIRLVAGDKIASAYEDINTADAQSYITWNEFKRRMTNFGMSDEAKGFIEAIEDRSKPFNPHDHAFKIQSLKYFLYNRSFDEGLNRMRSDQIKNSIHVLIPRFIEGTELETLANYMEDTGLNQVNFESAVKVGTKTVLQLHDKETGALKDLYDMDEEIKAAHQTYDYSALRIQLDVPNHIFDAENKLGIQISKVIFNNLQLDGDYMVELPDGTTETIKGRQLRDEYFDLYTMNVYSSLVKLSDSLGADISNKAKYNNDLYEGFTFTGDALREALENYLLESGADNNILTAITKDDVYAEALEKMGVTEVPPTQIPIFAIAYVDKIISVLGSKFTNQIINQKFPGSHCAIVANAFMNRAAGLEEDGSIVGVNYTTKFKDDVKAGLRDYRLRCEKYRGGDKNVTKAEVLLTPWMKAFYQEGELINIDDLPSFLRTQIGYRIPTEDKHSMVVFEVVGFIENGSSTIVLPDEMTVRSGLDFDIDSEYMMQYNLRQTKTGTFEAIEYLPKDDERSFDRYVGDVARDQFKEVNDKFFDAMANLGAERTDVIVKANAMLNQAKSDIAESAKNYKEVLKTVAESNEILASHEASVDVINSQLEYLINKPDATSQEVLDQTNGKYSEVNDAVQALTVELSNLNSDISSLQGTMDELETLLNQYKEVHPESLQNYFESKQNIKEYVGETFNNYAAKIAEVNEERLETLDKVKESYRPEFNALSREQQNSLPARQNRMLSHMIAILQNPRHYGELVAPSDVEHVYSAQNEVEKYFTGVKRDKNFNRPSDLANMRQLNLSVRELKGNSVAFDGVMAIYQAANITLGEHNAVEIKYDNLTPEEITWYINNYPKGTKINGDGSITVRYKNFLKTETGGLKNVYGENLTAQIAEVTPAILDAVKAPMSRNMNTHTLSVYRLFSALGVTHNIKGGPNSHAYATAMIEQPIVYKLIQERISRSGLLYEGAHVNQATNFITDGLHSDIFNTTVKSLLSEQSLQMHNNLMKVVEEQKAQGNKANVLLLATDLKTARPNMASQADLYIKELSEAYEKITNKFTKASGKRYSKEKVDAAIKALRKSFETGEAYEPKFFERMVVRDVFKAEDQALSYEDLVSNIQYESEKLGNNLSADAKFYMKQLNVLNKWLALENTSQAVTAGIGTFNADKKAAGPEIGVLDKMFENIKSLTFDQDRIESAIIERYGSKSMEYKELKAAFKGEEYATILAMCKREEIEPSSLMIDGDPATMAIYPSFFNMIEPSAYKPLDSYLKYGQMPAYRLLTKVSFTHKESVLKTKAAVFTEFGLREDKQTVGAFNKFLMNYPVMNMPIIKSLYRNGKAEYKVLLGLAEDQITLNQLARESSFDEVVASMDEDTFKQLSLVDKIRYALHDKSDIKEDIDSYGSAHILNLISLQNNAQQVKNRGYVALTLNSKGNDLNIISDSMQALFNSPNAKERALVEDLIRYAFVVDGLGFTYKGLGKVVPAAVLVDLGYSELLRAFQADPVPVLTETIEYVTAFAQSNWRNENIAPRLPKDEVSEVTKSGVVGISIKKLKGNMAAKQFITVETKVFDEELKRQTTKTVLYKRYTVEGADPLVNTDAETLDATGTVLYYPIKKLMPNEIGDSSVLPQNNQLSTGKIIMDESMFRMVTERYIAKQRNAVSEEDHTVKRITKADPEPETGTNLVSGEDGFLNNIEHVIAESKGTLNLRFGGRVNEQARVLTPSGRLNMAVTIKGDHRNELEQLAVLLENNKNLYITGPHIGSINESMNANQGQIDVVIDQYVNALSGAFDFSEYTIHTTGETGVEEAVTKAFSKYGAKVIVTHPKGNIYHNEAGEVKKHNNQTERFKYAEVLETGDPIADAFDQLGETDDISKAEKAQQRLEFITKQIAEASQVSKMFATLGSSQFATDSAKISKEYAKVVYSDLVNNDLQAQELALGIMARNSRVTLDFITSRIKVFENSTFAKLIKTPKTRTSFTNMMKYAQTFIKTFEGIDQLEPIVGENLSDREKSINGLIEELKEYASEADTLHSTWSRILRRYQEARLNQNVTNPHLIEDIKNIWDTRDDLNIGQFQFDSVAETGDAFVDNYIKVLMLNEAEKGDEVREVTGKFHDAFEKWYGTPYTRGVTGLKITESTRKDVTKKFYKTFVDPQSGHLITKYDYSSYQADLAKALKALEQGRKEGGDAAAQARVDFNRWMKENSTKEALYRGVRVNTLVANAQKEMSENQFKQYIRQKNFKQTGNTWYYMRPADHYKNERYAAMFNEDGSTKNKDGEFLAYLTNTIEETLEFDGAPTVFEGFLPNIPDHDRTNMQSLMNFFGASEGAQSTSEFAGVGDEEVFFLDLPFMARIVEPNAKQTIVINREISPVVELERINELGHKFKSLDEVEEYNDEVRARSRSYSADHKEFDILRVMEAFISGTTDYKYKTQIEKEMLLFVDQIGNLEFNVKKRGGLLTKTALSNLTGEQEYATKKGEDSRLKERVQSFMKSYFYGVKPDKKHLDKAMNVIMNMTSARSMWLNVTSGLGNVTKGRTDILMEAGAGEFIDKASLRKADKMYFGKAMNDAIANGASEKSDTKEGALLKRLNIVELHDERAIIMNPKIKNLMDSLLLKTDSFYIFMNSTEHYMQNVMLLSMSQSHRVIDGKIVSKDQYIGDIREETLNSLMTSEQKAEYNKFIGRGKKKIKEGKSDRFRVAANTIPDFLLKGETVTDELRSNFASELKSKEAAAKEEFEKNATVFDTMDFVDGELVTNIDNNELNLFKRKVISVNHQLHGVYNKFDAGHIQKDVWGQMLLQFRKWMRPNWNRFYGARFGKSQWSEGLQTEKKGAYTSWAEFVTRPAKGHNIFKPSKEDQTSWRAIKNIIHDYGKFITKARLHYQALSPTDKANVKRVNVQMLTFASMAALLFGLGKLREDDRDLKESYTFSLALFQLNRLYMELTEFAPVYGWANQLNRTLEYPAAGEKAMLDLLTFMQNFFAYPIRSEEERKYQNGRKYGRDRLYDSFIQNTPILTQFDKMMNIEDYVAYYKMYQLF